MKRFSWLVLLMLVTAFPVSAQDPAPKIAAPSVKLAAVTLLVKDYDKAAKWYSEISVLKCATTKT